METEKSPIACTRKPFLSLFIKRSPAICLCIFAWEPQRWKIARPIIQTPNGWTAFCFLPQENNIGDSFSFDFLKAAAAQKFSRNCGFKSQRKDSTEEFEEILMATTRKMQFLNQIFANSHVINSAKLVPLESERAPQKSLNK
jgi:hypothetical protein